MHEELKRNNSIGNLKGFLVFTRAVISDNPVKKESVHFLCQSQYGVTLNINAAIAFFEFLGLIEVESKKLIATDLGKMLKDVSDEELKEKISTLCFQKIISEGILSNDAIHFNPELTHYYIEKRGFLLQSAIFRNTLIQLGAVYEQDNILLICNEYEEVFAFAQKKNRHKITLEQLKKKLEAQEAQGALAEEFVVAFEQKRITNAVLRKKIKQISNVDVSAGYDIVSFEDDESVIYDRFIEVKSYQDVPRFYWSKNEINTAMALSKKYYLYLVDVTQIKKPMYKPIVILDPYETIIKKENTDWLVEPESYLVIKI